MTIAIAAGAKEIGGETYKLKTRALRIASPTPPVTVPYRLENATGGAFTATWTPIEGPLHFALFDQDELAGTGASSHSLDCWSASGSQSTTTFAAVDFNKMHWTPPVGASNNGSFTVGSSQAQTTKLPSGATLNVYSTARSWAFLLVN